MSAEEIILKGGSYSAGISPAHGAVMTFLRVGDRDLLRPALSLAAIKKDPRDGACFPCVPYFGRLYGGLTFGDQHWDQAPTLTACDSENALHGEGWVSPWGITTQADDTLTLALNHQPKDGRYPFPYRASLSLSLTKDGASFAMSLTNTGETPMPAGMGLHPYFERMQLTKIAFEAETRWTPPRGSANATAHDGSAAQEYAGGAALPANTIDDSYSGFSGSVTLTTGNGSVLVTSSAEILHLFAPEGGDFFCMEPVTHLPGAHSGRVDMDNIPQPMAPGDTRSIMMTVSA